jgi:deoxyribonuclease-1-like protein
VPRSYSMFLVSILAAGGWYFSKHPGKFQEFVAAITQSQKGNGQTAPGGYLPQSAPYSSYPSQQPAVPVQANYNGVPAAPATPTPTPKFGGPAIRIATFNVQVFGEKKGNKPYVMATIADIIKQFQVVAIQEIRTENEYFIDNFLRTYVNADGRKYDKVIGPRLGRTKSKEQYAFIYDTAAIDVNPRCVFTVNDPDDLLEREPFVAMFRVRGPPPEQAFTFVLMDVHTSPARQGDPHRAEKECDALAKAYEAVRRAVGGEDDIIMLGDFNVDDHHLGDLARIPGIYPIVRSRFTNTKQNNQEDNIIIHGPSTTEFTGRWDVLNVQQQYKLPLSQAVEVSDHFPVWAEFNAYESTTPGRVATRDAATQVQ